MNTSGVVYMHAFIHAVKDFINLKFTYTPRPIIVICPHTYMYKYYCYLTYT